MRRFLARSRPLIGSSNAFIDERDLSFGSQQDPRKVDALLLAQGPRWHLETGLKCQAMTAIQGNE